MDTYNQNTEPQGEQLTEYKSIDQLPPELNIRDLGGLATSDGRHIRRGLIFRSAALASFNEKELVPVRKLGLKTILDFRSEKKASEKPDPLIEGADYYNKCAAFQNILDDLNSPWELASLIFDKDQKGNPASVLISSYSASLAFSNESYKFMFDCLLNERAPLLFHCSNGKDRTGIAAMLVLLALGVPEEIVRKDYLQSNINRVAQIDKLMHKYRTLSSMSGNAQSFLTMIEGVLSESADMTMSEILERYGTYENYMEIEYGFDSWKLRKFRDFYLTDDKD